jgi:hypothetical protein
MTSFEKELQKLINRYNKESESNTPDFILATYLKTCLDAFDTAIKSKDEWFGNTQIGVYTTGTCEPIAVIDRVIGDHIDCTSGTDPNFNVNSQQRQRPTTKVVGFLGKSS